MGDLNGWSILLIISTQYQLYTTRRTTHNTTGTLSNSPVQHAFSGIPLSPAEGAKKNETFHILDIIGFQCGVGGMAGTDNKPLKREQARVTLCLFFGRFAPRFPVSRARG